MRTTTIQETLLRKWQKTANMNEKLSLVDEIVNEIINTDPMLVSVDKSWVNYGTWRVRLWTNCYHFGKELSDKLKKCTIITHDEDKKFTPEDLREEIDSAVYDFADNWDFDKEEEE